MGVRAPEHRETASQSDHKRWDIKDGVRVEALVIIAGSSGACGSVLVECVLEAWTARHHLLKLPQHVG